MVRISINQIIMNNGPVKQAKEINANGPWTVAREANDRMLLPIFATPKTATIPQSPSKTENPPWLILVVLDIVFWQTSTSSRLHTLHT